MRTVNSYAGFTEFDRNPSFLHPESSKFKRQHYATPVKPLNINRVLTHHTSTRLPHIFTVILITHSIKTHTTQRCMYIQPFKIKKHHTSCSILSTYISYKVLRGRFSHHACLCVFQRSVNRRRIACHWRISRGTRICQLLYYWSVKHNSRSSSVLPRNIIHTDV